MCWKTTDKNGIRATDPRERVRRRLKIKAAAEVTFLVIMLAVIHYLFNWFRDDVSEEQRVTNLTISTTYMILCLVGSMVSMSARSFIGFITLFLTAATTIMRVFLFVGWPFILKWKSARGFTTNEIALITVFGILDLGVLFWTVLGYLQDPVKAKRGEDAPERNPHSLDTVTARLLFKAIWETCCAGSFIVLCVFVFKMQRDFENMVLSIAYLVFCVMGCTFSLLARSYLNELIFTCSLSTAIFRAFVLITWALASEFTECQTLLVIGFSIVDLTVTVITFYAYYNSEHASRESESKERGCFLKAAAFLPPVAVLLSVGTEAVCASLDTIANDLKLSWKLTITTTTISTYLARNYAPALIGHISCAVTILSITAATILHNSRTKLYPQAVQWVLYTLGCVSPMALIFLTIFPNNKHIVPHMMFTHICFKGFILYELVNTVCYCVLLYSDSRRRTTGNFLLIVYWFLTLTGCLVSYVTFKRLGFSDADVQQYKETGEGAETFCCHLEWMAVAFVWTYFLGFSYVFSTFHSLPAEKEEDDAKDPPV